MKFQLLSCVIRPAESMKAESSEHSPNLLCLVHTDGKVSKNSLGRKPQETSLLCELGGVTLTSQQGCGSLAARL